MGSLILWDRSSATIFIGLLVALLIAAVILARTTKSKHG